MIEQERTTILVTGVGGTVGQALIKAARQMALPCRIVGIELCAEEARWNTANGLQPVSVGYFPAYRCPAAPVGKQQFFAKKTAAPCAATPQ
jgi:nucleoside-diphosphate-sugar epimerase